MCCQFWKSVDFSDLKLLSESLILYSVFGSPYPICTCLLYFYFILLVLKKIILRVNKLYQLFLAYLPFDLLFQVDLGGLVSLWKPVKKREHMLPLELSASAMKECSDNWYSFQWWNLTSSSHLSSCNVNISVCQYINNDKGLFLVSRKE